MSGRMNADEMLLAMRKAICSGVEAEAKGLDRYFIRTGYTYHDGDELYIVLKKDEEKGNWIFTDEGHTLMWMSYDDFEFTPSRTRLFDKILRANSAHSDNGVIKVSFSLDKIGDALYSITQALLQVADIRFLSVDQVRSTFMEDLREHIRKNVSQESYTFNYNPPDEKKGKYSVDIRVNTEQDPLFVFGVFNDLKSLETIVKLQHYAKSGTKFSSVIVISDDASLTQMNRDRLTGVADKQFSSLNSAKEGMLQYFEKHSVPIIDSTISNLGHPSGTP
jgi:hypothetical protein